ncbi:GTPase Era, partial [Ruminococcaceae bacterium OttesenSCG-928-D13]|nr:GTPase Era [Ruminococcaceae bacterium OttesenSCG-928-D13]
AARKIELLALGAFNEVLIISAATGEGCDELLEKLAEFAVEGPHFFAEDMYTDQPEKQLVAEVIREKLLLFMQEEIPHGTAVEVEKFHEREKGNIVDIEATIYCERKSHKGMVIGRGGAMLKQIATAARQECEELLGCKINLQCWVKVREGWRDNENMLNRMGWK